jgi:hypothetical protein
MGIILKSRKGGKKTYSTTYGRKGTSQAANWGRRPLRAFAGVLGIPENNDIIKSCWRWFCKKLQMKGAQNLRSEGTYRYAATIHPVRLIPKSLSFLKIRLLTLYPNEDSLT